ncbi:MAG: hypothetical protein ACJ8IK_14595 [Burkholderiaceae bacterium]
MRTPILAALLGALCMGLAACGGDDTVPQTRTLAAGQSYTIGPNQTFYVPSNTVVDSSSGRVTITGHAHTIDVSVGAVVTAAADARGPADNLVISHAR